MPTAHASSTSSTDGDGKPKVDTMTSGANSSAAAKSTGKDGQNFFETSRTTTDKDGTHTTKTTGTRNAIGEREADTASKDLGKDKNDKAGEADEADETDGQEGVFAKASNAFAAAGGAIAGVKDGKAVATAT